MKSMNPLKVVGEMIRKKRCSFYCHLWVLYGWRKSPLTFYFELTNWEGAGSVDRSRQQYGYSRAGIQKYAVPFITTVLRVCWKICCHLDPFQKCFLAVSSRWPCSIQDVASWHPHTKMVSSQGGFCSHLFSIEHLSMSLFKKKDKRQKTNKRKKNWLTSAFLLFFSSPVDFLFTP